MNSVSQLVPAEKNATFFISQQTVLALWTTVTDGPDRRTNQNRRSIVSPIPYLKHVQCQDTFVNRLIELFVHSFVRMYLRISHRQKVTSVNNR